MPFDISAVIRLRNLEERFNAFQVRLGSWILDRDAFNTAHNTDGTLKNAMSLVAGTNISVVVDDATDTVTINGAVTTEVIRDTIGTALVAGSNVTVTVNDAADTITIAAPLIDDKVAKAGDTMTGLLTVGTGDAANVGTSVVSGQVLRVKHGTAASPAATYTPTFKAERTAAVTRATVIAAGGSGDGSVGAAAIMAVSNGITGNELQPIGVYSFASNSVPEGGGYAGSDDACGMYALGRIISVGTGTGIGAALYGRRDNDLGAATGAEIATLNYNGGTAPVYNSTGYQKTQGIWMTAHGDADSSTAIMVGNPFGMQFLYGLAFNAQVVGGKTGGVSLGSIRDDGNATTSYIINGTHDYGIDMNGGTFTTAAIRAKGHVHFATDNSFDIGASTSASRPRTIYLGSQVILGGNGLLLQLQNSGGKLVTQRATAAVSNPGANYGALYFRDGTTAGTLKLCVRAGAAGAETTIFDNIPQ